MKTGQIFGILIFAICIMFLMVILKSTNKAYSFGGLCSVERIEEGIYRRKVINGWIVHDWSCGSGRGMCFVPDKNHEWKITDYQTNPIRVVK